MREGFVLVGFGFLLSVGWCIAIWKFVLEPHLIKAIEDWKRTP